MQEKKSCITTTERKIGKVTYIIRSSTSDKATETLERKLEKIIKKDAVQISNS